MMSLIQEGFKKIKKAIDFSIDTFQFYEHEVEQLLISTDDLFENPYANQSSSWHLLYLFPFLLIYSLPKAIFYNIYASLINGFIEPWNVLEYDEEQKIKKILSRPWFGYLIGLPSQIVGWSLGASAIFLYNLGALLYSFYLNLCITFLPQLTEKQHKHLQQLIKPKTALAYAIALIPGLLAGVLLSNIRVLMDGFIMAWNDVWSDKPTWQVSAYSNHGWWLFLGRILSWIPRLVTILGLLPIRLIGQNLVGVFEGLISGYKYALNLQAEPFFNDNKLGLVGKTIGFGLSYFLLLNWQMLSNSMGQLARVIKFTNRLNYADYYEISLKDLGFKWLGVPGLILSIPLVVVQTIVTLSWRFLKQNFITWVNFFILAYYKAKAYSLNDEELETGIYQIEQNLYEKKVGVTSWILTQGWVFYIMTFLLSLAFIVLIETTIRMFYYFFIYFLELAFWDKNVSLVDYPTLAGRDVFGLIGSLIGLVCGMVLALAITVLRFTFETFSGLLLGLRGLEMAHQNQVKTNYQISLSILGYALGRLIRANLILPLNLLYHVYTLVYVDHIRPFDIDESELLYLDKLDYLLGVGISGLPGLILSTLGGVVLVAWRIIFESLVTFLDSLPQLLRFSKYYDAKRSGLAQFVYGGPGLIIACIPSLVVGALVVSCSPFIAMYKWLNMLTSSRFDNYHGEEHQLTKIKKLFGLLNNLERSFLQQAPQNLDDIPSNPKGGKGSMCFISKLVGFNQPSIAEVYMDKVLEKQKVKPQKLSAGDYEEIRQEVDNTVKMKYSFWNEACQNKLEFTHQYVSRQLR